MRILQSFCAANRRIAVLLLRRVSPISTEWYFAVCGFVLTKLTSSFFVELLYCMAHKLCTGSKLQQRFNNRYITAEMYTISLPPRSKLVGMYVGVHPSHAVFDDLQLCAVLLRRFHPSTTSWLPFHYSRNTVRFRGCLWWLWLCWCLSTNLRTPFDNSADILDDAAKKLRITDAHNPQIW